MILYKLQAKFSYFQMQFNKKLLFKHWLCDQEEVEQTANSWN